jgi:hypothetical protein
MGAALSPRRIAILLLTLLVSLSAGADYPVEGFSGGLATCFWAGQGAALATPNELYINPAGLALATLSDFVATGSLPALDNHRVGCYGMNLIKPLRTETAGAVETKTLGTLAASLHQFSSNTVVNNGRDYHPTQSLAAISFGTTLGDDTALGLNFKVLTVDDGERADSGFGIDLGLLYHPENLRVGFAISNLIPPGLSLNNERTIAKRLLRLGVGYELFGLWSLALEGSYLTEAEELNYGLYTTLTPLATTDLRLTLNGGYSISNEQWGAGLSLRVGLIEVGWAIASQQDDYGHSFRLSLSPEF